MLGSDLHLMRPSATFLYNNHRQAINIITESEDQLHALESLHEVSRTNFIAYLDEEREYLGRLKEAPKALTIRIRYGQALELYYAYQYVETSRYYFGCLDIVITLFSGRSYAVFVSDWQHAELGLVLLMPR
jgi:hypothetical protein